MSTKPIKTKPLIKNKTLTEESLDKGWKVVLFNCYCHTTDEVEDKLMDVLNLGYAARSLLIDEAEKTGSVVVFEGSFSDCTRIANLLGNTGLDVRMTN